MPIEIKKYCPSQPRCSGAERLPRKLTSGSVERIKADIDAANAAGKKWPQLPELQPGGHFYICGYCNAVWKETSPFSTDSIRTVLGKLDGVGDIGWVSAI
jgi:hypothetical protein